MTDTVAADQLKAFIERIETIEAQKAVNNADIKEIYQEAKSNGFDTKALRKVLCLRKKDLAKRQEEEAILDLYLVSLGMA